MIESLAVTKTIDLLQLKKITYDVESKLITVEYGEGYQDGAGNFMQLSSHFDVVGTSDEYPGIFNPDALRATLKSKGTIIEKK